MSGKQSMFRVNFATSQWLRLILTGLPRLTASRGLGLRIGLQMIENVRYCGMLRVCATTYSTRFTTTSF
jgi:hypothetical protein